MKKIRKLRNARSEVKCTLLSEINRRVKSLNDGNRKPTDHHQRIQPHHVCQTQREHPLHFHTEFNQSAMSFYTLFFQLVCFKGGVAWHGMRDELF